MSHLLPSEKLEEQLPKLLPGVLALYKKHAETSHVSKVQGPAWVWSGAPASDRSRSSPESRTDPVVGGALHWAAAWDLFRPLIPRPLSGPSRPL